MNLTELHKQTEEKYLRLPEDFFNEKWGDTKLWSHDLSHHKRVWNYAADIYLKRGIAPEDLGKKVLENAGKRFENLETTSYKYPALIQKHRNRYLIICEF